MSFSCILSFLLFNFPRAKLFLGDGGSYLIGSLISYLIIETSNYNPNISPFFFSCLLYYLFFEVFFSFLRKFFYDKKNPLIPDRFHLHMLFFVYRNKKNNLFLANYTTGIYINLIYLVSLLSYDLILPCVSIQNLQLLVLSSHCTLKLHLPLLFNL